MPIFTNPKHQPVDAQGDPYAGAKLYFYSAGTLTPVTTYSDSALTVAHSNPVIANSAGQFAPIYLSPATTYRVIQRSTDDVLLWDVDNYDQASFSQASLAVILNPRTTAEITAGVTPTNYVYQEGDARRYGAVTGNSTDCTTAFQNALDVVRLAGGGLATCGPGESYKITSKLTIGASVDFDGRGATLWQHTANTGILEVSGGSGDITRATIRNVLLRYVTAQSAAQTSAIGLRCSVASRTTYLINVTNVTADKAYRGFDVPNLTSCFSFFTQFNRCVANDCSDYGFYIQGDTASGGCTNIGLDDCWVLQTNGAETAGSKGYAFIGVSQLEVGNIATDHIQDQYGLWAQQCTGTIGSFVAESCDIVKTSGTNAWVLLDSCALDIGYLGFTANTVSMDGGTTTFAPVRFAASVEGCEIEIANFRDLSSRDPVTDPDTPAAPSLTGGATYYAAIVSNSGNRIRIHGHAISGYTPAVALSDPNVPYQIEYFDGSDRTYLTGSATYDPANLVDGAGATTTVTVTGAALGDYVEAVSFSNDLQGITLTGWVSATDTVSVRFQNESGGALDLASGTLRARVKKV